MKSGGHAFRILLVVHNVYMRDIYEHKSRDIQVHEMIIKLPTCLLY